MLHVQLQSNGDSVFARQVVLGGIWTVFESIVASIFIDVLFEMRPIYRTDVPQTLQKYPQRTSSGFRALVDAKLHQEVCLPRKCPFKGLKCTNAN